MSSKPKKTARGGPRPSKPAAVKSRRKVAAGAAAAIHRRGLLLVLSSPSGAGKSTLARRLLERDPGMVMSVSVTTRTPRPGEVDGVHYHFIDDAEFGRRRGAGKLLESATVFGRSYGTPKQPVLDWLERGRDVLFDIDWQGTQQLAEQLPRDLVRVFILPPDGPTLEKRLRERGTDSADVVAERMRKAAQEISHWAEYDYVIVNRDLERATAELVSILAAERLRRSRQLGLADFVAGIVGAL